MTTIGRIEEEKVDDMSKFLLPKVLGSSTGADACCLSRGGVKNKEWASGFESDPFQGHV